VAVFDLDAGAEPGSAASGLAGALDSGQVQVGDPSSPLVEIVSKTSAPSSAVIPPPELPPKV
jgi:hypothetical protein